MIYVHLRRSLDWADEAAVDAGLVAKFRPKLETWDATFNIPYRCFRLRLKEIAQLNLSRVEGALFADLDAVPQGAIVAPVDDDDWFSPDLVARLTRASDPAFVGYRWIRHILEPERHRRRFKGLLKEALTRRVILATNNYAIRNRPGVETLLNNHLSASYELHARLAEFKYLRAALSIHNRSLASQTVLAYGRPSLTRDELIETYETHRMLYARTRLSRGLRWAAPYVALMAELMDDLKPK